MRAAPITLVSNVRPPGLGVDVDHPAQGSDPGGVDEGVDAAQALSRLSMAAWHDESS